MIATRGFWYTISSLFSITIWFIFGIIASAVAIVFSPIIIVGLGLCGAISEKNLLEGRTLKTMCGITQEKKTKEPEKNHEGKLKNLGCGLAYGVLFCLLAPAYTFTLPYNSYKERYPKQDTFDEEGVTIESSQSTTGNILSRLLSLLSKSTQQPTKGSTELEAEIVFTHKPPTSQTTTRNPPQ